MFYFLNIKLETYHM